MPLVLEEGLNAVRKAPLHKAEGGRFEDPLMSMPPLRRNSAAEPCCGSPLMQSPSLKASGGLSTSSSFSARRTTLEFRRSLPGGPSPPAAAGSPAEPNAAGRGSASREPRGLSEYGQADGFPAAALYASPKGMSEGGSRGGGEEARTEEESTDADVDFALRFVGRQRSFSGAAARDAPRDAAAASASAAGSSGALGLGRSSMRIADEEDFLHRLQHNRCSWRERSRSGAAAGAPSQAAAGEGLQNKTHAALEQLRGELRSLSLRCMVGGGAAPCGGSAAGGGGGGVSGVSASSALGDGHGAAASQPSSGQQQAGVTVAVTAPVAGVATPGGAAAGPRRSEGYSPGSPSRLSVGHRNSGGGGAGGQQLSPLHMQRGR